MSCKDFGYCGPLVSEVISLLRVRKKDFAAQPSPVEPSQDEVVSLLDLEDEEVGKRNRFPLQSLLRNPTTKSLLGNPNTKNLLDFNEEETLAI